MSEIALLEVNYSNEHTKLLPKLVVFGNLERVVFARFCSGGVPCGWGGGWGGGVRILLESGFPASRGRRRLFLPPIGGAAFWGAFGAVSWLFMFLYFVDP